jgi:hypothetical protein
MVPRERSGYVAWGMPADDASAERLRVIRGAA